jgi:multidrug efflux pump subunit AcrB
MSLTQDALKNPAAVAVAIAIAMLFGLFSLTRLPVQLFPNIERPNIQIQTFWRSASPREVESQILEPQEEVLLGLPGMTEMNTFAGAGNAFVNLEFSLDTDMQQMLIEVISRLNRVPPLPRDATPPQINSNAFGDSNQALSWFFIQVVDGDYEDIDQYLRIAEDVVRPRIEAVPGVAGIQMFAGAPEELQIRFDPFRAAELGIDIPTVASLAASSDDVSGGFVDVGRRQYTLRFEGRYEPERLGEMILDWRDGRPIRLSDVADIEVRPGDRFAFTVQNGNPAISVRVDRATGANVLEALSLVKVEVAELNATVLADNGLYMAQSFDASVFIKRAINLVTTNLGLGILLAVGVLWWFLRDRRATLLIATAIPISLLTTFVVLDMAGRTLNVISLAGLAFATGMVLDAAIVVLENIVRMRESGASAHDASEQGTMQVWGALLASTATTVAIFLPVIFLRDVEGQLFADLALTIAIAVSISLLVAMVILPTLAKLFLRTEALHDDHGKWWDTITAKVMWATDLPKRRFGIIGVMMTVPVLATWLMFPRMDYLPPVKRDAVDVFFNFPPGMNIEFKQTEVADLIIERLQPYMDGEMEPALKNYYIILFPNGGTIGARVQDRDRLGELLEIMQSEILVGLPDTQAFAFHGNLFGGFGDGRGINMQLQARDDEVLRSAARVAMGLIAEALPEAQAQPPQNMELSEPELRLFPNDQSIIEAGWSRNNIAQVVRTFGDGMFVGEYFDGEKRMNIILRADGWETPEELESIPLVTGSGAVIPLGDLVDVTRTVGPSGLARVDRRRTLNINISPPPDMSLEEAIQVLREQVEPGVREVLPSDGAVRYGGNASSLEAAITNMGQNFILALLILFMLMAALFRSMKDSALVVLALPLATVGGVAALRIAGLTMDLLTMIGFIILLGLVVNNAILLVHQTREAERQGANRKDAVNQALRLRMRPIFMSTLTSIFGMLPLVLIPGVGSVIYRGLATVIVGGMSVSTIFTLLLLPSLMRLGESATERRELSDYAPSRS